MNNWLIVVPSFWSTYKLKDRITIRYIGNFSILERSRLKLNILFKGYIWSTEIDFCSDLLSIHQISKSGTCWIREHTLPRKCSWIETHIICMMLNWNKQNKQSDYHRRSNQLIAGVYLHSGFYEPNADLRYQWSFTLYFSYTYDVYMCITDILHIQQLIPGFKRVQWCFVFYLFIYQQSARATDERYLIFIKYLTESLSEVEFIFWLKKTNKSVDVHTAIRLIEKDELKQVLSIFKFGKWNIKISMINI